MAPYEHEPFLSTDDKYERASEEIVPCQATDRPSSRQLRISFVIHVFLVVVYTTTSLIFFRATTAHCRNTNSGTNVTPKSTRVSAEHAHSVSGPVRSV